MMNIVLLEPEIPDNTGNIGRTCVATNTPLHLIRPFGFIINERGLKRAGMDYWDRLSVSEYINYSDFISHNKTATVWYATTKAGQCYTEVKYGPDDFIMFGKESAGIPEVILKENRSRCIRIPMYEDERSLNLANSVAVILYEALRQNGFEGLKKEGFLSEKHCLL
ncbi:MAG: tRNA (cytidine(34)-2'-O)-methyltransferase [Lachnospiraceae bacterium]|nr:tRNA (cytidine(34)-2'-O)-methyltransferase [Lachnospiraceae bacterium]